LRHCVQWQATGASGVVPMMNLTLPQRLDPLSMSVLVADGAGPTAG
jgi:hypothetical protein